jgi:polyhydroxyalkanoate synthase subunit PhaC
MTDEPKSGGDDPMAMFAAFRPDNFFTPLMSGIRPEAMMKQAFDLFSEMTKIATGQSEIAADPKDGRFKDKAWAESPIYQRWLQAYLAMTDAMEKMIPEDLPFEQRARAELATSIVTSTLAPTNTLIGNPAALAKTVETGGSNLANGFRNFLDDLQNNGGLPRQVDDSQFELGRNMAMTPGSVVLRTEMFELIHYKAATDKVSETPVLLIPPQIGRFYFTDLAPGRSFAEYVVAQGLNYFAISWRNPSPDERGWGLEEYLHAAVEAVEAVSAISGQPKVNLLGFCAGGMLTAIMLGWLAAGKRDLVNSLTICVTMLDFKSDASIGAFRLPTMLSVARAQSKMKGVLAGDELHKVFTWLRPNDLVWNYWVNNYLMGEEPPAFDILAWNKDSTNLPAKLHEDFLDLFESNALLTADAYEIAGRKIDLGKIQCDNFVVGAVTDHLTPWKACYKSVNLLPGKSTFALSNGGHIAALVNPPNNPKAHHWIADATEADADSWQATAPKTEGSWWESWTKWCAERSGSQVAAPKTPGSKDFPELCAAPGIYVREVRE